MGLISGSPCTKGKILTFEHHNNEITNHNVILKNKNTVLKKRIYITLKLKKNISNKTNFQCHCM